MHPLPLRLSAICAAFLILPTGWAQEAAPAPSAQQELKELRHAVELQTKQIELLAEQVGRLTRALVAQQPGPEVATPTARTGTLSIPAPTANTAPSTSIAPKPLPPLPDVPPTASPASGTPKTEGVPTAEAVPGTKHVVAKGETLTSIAKQYNISLSELKNANKIENDRKLQIGQILSVPSLKTPDSPDKKENQ
jgi:LysM repeat protein